MLLSLVLPEGQNDKNICLSYWVGGVDIHWNYPSGNKVEIRLLSYSEYVLRGSGLCWAGELVGVGM
jgi:hypothetical protein